jgi:hypothetical protein
MAMVPPPPPPPSPCSGSVPVDNRSSEILRGENRNYALCSLDPDLSEIATNRGTKTSRDIRTIFAYVSMCLFNKG